VLPEGPTWHLDADMACAIALGFVEHPHVVVTLHGLQPAQTNCGEKCLQASWFEGDDLLVSVTRDYLGNRKESSPGRSSVANQGMGGLAGCRSTLARALGWVLVVERGILARAEAAGLRVKKWGMIASECAQVAGTAVTWKGWPPISAAERN
jgi:hypothetical protein